MRILGYTTAVFLLVLGLASCNGGGISSEEQARVDSLANLPRRDYARGGVAFSLADIEGLKPVNKDSVPWAMYMVETDSNGQIGYYFYPGYPLELAAPQIRIEYMHRNLKGCSEPDSLFAWLKGIYLSPERQGKVLSEDKLGTLDGQVIKLLEIETPEYKVDDSTSHSGKTMAWAYAEHGDRLVGFSYSAITKDDYRQGIAQFKNLVRSYKDNLQ